MRLVRWALEDEDAVLFVPLDLPLEARPGDDLHAPRRGRCVAFADQRHADPLLVGLHAQDLERTGRSGRDRGAPSVDD
jgi:hypothetical protein